MDITDSLAANSAQQNYDEYLAGPKTVTVAEVTQGTVEQPVNVELVEFPGKPFKPAKSVRRVLAAAWGTDASQWTGRRLTIYGDPSVRYGGKEVGGLRVSHVSHIDKPITVALTVTRGKRAPFTVQPLPDAPPVPPIPDDVQTLAQYQDYYRHRAQSGATAEELAMIQQNAPTNEENNA